MVELADETLSFASAKRLETGEMSKQYTIFLLPIPEREERGTS